MHLRSTGFTLVELVVVLVLISILAAYVAPRFAGRGGFSELTVQQDLIQSIRFAQQAAMSRTDRTIVLITTANSINIRDETSPPFTPLLGYPKQTPNDVTLSAANLVFNRFGFAGNDNTTITVTGTPQVLSVTVEGATGYAH